MINWLKKILNKSDDRAFIDRNVRIRLLNEDSVKLIAEDNRFSVMNLSGSGIGFLSEVRQLSVGDLLEASLSVEKKIVPVQLEIVRKQESFYGAKYISGSDQVVLAMRMIFMDEYKASEMSEVSSERLATKLNGKPRWFYGAGNYELFFIEDLGNILRFELEWQGHVFTREYGKPLRAGFINSEDRDKPSHAKSAIVQWQKEYSQELLIKAARIVENIPGLELEFRKQIQKFLLEM